MWPRILAFNSFVVMPLTFVFLVYSGMQAVFFWVWKPFWIAVVVLVVALIMQVVIAILND